MEPSLDAPPRWEEYVAGGLLKDTDATALSSLDPANVRQRAAIVSAVLAKTVSQEVTRFVLNVLKAAHSIDLDADDSTPMMHALVRVVEQFEGTPLHIDALASMAKVLQRCAEVTSARLFFAVSGHTLRSMSPELCIEALTSIAVVLEVPSSRQLFASDTVLLDALLNCLLNVANQPQLHYNALLCLWLASFDHKAVKLLLATCSIVSATVAICRATSKEKVIRVGIGFWRNLLERGREEVLPILIGSKAADFVSGCLKKKFPDPDLAFDLQAVNAELEAAIVKLTTFDEYASEVLSGNLDWTPPHKSMLFWKDNVTRLNESDCELLKYVAHASDLCRLLVGCLTSSSPKVVAIAAHDIGEYLKFHPAGKR